MGLEFAQMYRRFGSRVTVVEAKPRLIAREDDEISAAIKEILDSEGVEVRLNVQCMSAKRRGGWWRGRVPVTTLPRRSLARTC